MYIHIKHLQMDHKINYVNYIVLIFKNLLLLSMIFKFNLNILKYENYNNN